MDMFGRIRTALGLAATGFSLWACASTTTDPAASGATVQTAATPGGSAAPAAAPPMNGPAVTSPGATATPAQQGGAPQTPSVMMPGAPAAPGAADPAMAPAAAAVVGPRGGCPDRKVSYHDPCGDDPDPCSLNSGWEGDEYCWPAPAEGEGIQMHVGPKDYNDPAEVAKYVVEPGTEFLNYLAGDNPMTENRFANHVMVRMRPGSHHWIVGLVGGEVEGGFYNTEGCGSSSVGGIGGGQSLIMDNPPNGEPAPEDIGYGYEVQGNSSVCINIHHYNFTEMPQIREAWINVYFTDEANITKRGERIGLIGGTGIAIPPGAEQELTYSVPFRADGRIRSLFGHRHKWTERFAVWVNEDLIYDSWDWVESVTFMYDSITTNPPVNPDGKMDGAKSGIVEVKSGDVLRYSCFVKNGSDVTLRFANEVETGEMCNLFGGTVGEGTGLSANNL
jgi:hypothetical protein